MKATIYRTNAQAKELLKQVETIEIPHRVVVDVIERVEDKRNDLEQHLINIHPDFTYQEIIGFGGAFTESAAEAYSALSQDKKQEFMEAYFSREKGIGYNFCRTHINSCDFSKEDFFYIKDGDTALESFNIAHDLEKRIPMIRDAQAYTDLRLFASPWTPPPFMKTVDAVQGGHLKKEYYATWAKYMHRFAQEYEKAGVPINAFTIQNEPRHCQTWESCNYTKEEEAEFLGYLGRELEGSGIDIWCYDHCRERNYERAKACMDSENAGYLKGIANHFYSGDHFGEIRAVRERYPNLLQIMSEGCISVRDHAALGADYRRVAEAYAHDITGAMNHGLNIYVDWNLTLDENGGPRHHWKSGGNSGMNCSTPIYCDGIRNEVVKNLLYYYIGHFSKFVQRGARNILTSSWTDKLDVAGFVNPDGSIAVVITNRTENDESFFLRIEDHVMEAAIPAHSILTVVIESMR